MKLKWSNLLVEFLSVVFAVLLALLLNAWRESNATQETLNRVKSNLREEIIRNDSLVNRAYDYRLDLLKAIKSGQHHILAQPVQSLGVNVNDDRALARFIRNANLFVAGRYFDNVTVERYEDRRVLIMDERVFKLEVRNDSLFLLGAGNLQLRSADISVHAWDIAQATEMLVQMDLEVVTALSKLNTLKDKYLQTSGEAIRYIYQGDQRAIISSMEDMLYQESQIIQMNQEILEIL